MQLIARLPTRSFGLNAFSIAAAAATKRYRIREGKKYKKNSSEEQVLQQKYPGPTF